MLHSFQFTTGKIEMTFEKPRRLGNFCLVCLFVQLSVEGNIVPPYNFIQGFNFEFGTGLAIRHLVGKYFNLIYQPPVYHNLLITSLP